MSTPNSTTRAPHWAWALLPLLLAAALRDLWAPDEPRYAQVAREAFESGSYLVLHRCGEVYPDKPPLYFWVIGLVGWLTDWSVFAMRLVPLTATAGIAALTASFARRWWGEREAGWAPLVFLGAALVVELGGRLQIDPLLGLLVVGAIHVATGPAATPRDAGLRLSLASVLVGLGGLAKGPVALVSFALVVLAWRLVPDDTGRARAPRATVVLAPLLALLPVASWAAAVIAREPQIADQLLYRQHVGRLASTGSHVGPPWEHLLHMPALLLPWTLPVLAGLVLAWRAWSRRDAARRTADPGLVRAGLWLLVLLAFFSLSRGKRDLYLLPAYPAAALLAARWIASRRPEGLPRGVGAFSVALFGGLAVAFAAAPWILAQEFEGLPSLRAAGVACASVALVAAFAAARAVMRRDVQRWAATTAAGWTALACSVALFVVPRIDSVKSPREVSLRLAHLPASTGPVPAFGVQPEGYRFYSGREVVAGDTRVPLGAALAELRERQGAAALALVHRDLWLDLDQATRADFEVLDGERVGSRPVLVVAPRSGSREILLDVPQRLQISAENALYELRGLISREDLSAGWVVIPARASEPPEEHLTPELYRVVQGAAVVEVGGVRHDVHPGSSVFVPAGIPHRIFDVTEDLGLIVAMPSELDPRRVLP